MSRPSVKAWIDDVRHALAAGQLDQRPQVVHRRVDAARRDEPEQVQALAAAGLAQCLVLEERAVLDRFADAQQVLPDDRARAEVEVADLGVAHLAFGQPDGGPPGGQGGVGIAPPEVVEDRRVRELDRVAGTGLGEAPAVEDDQGYSAHAATMRARPSGSRLAPPTSAPSTSSSARISAALSGFTLPP